MTPEQQAAFDRLRSAGLFFSDSDDDEESPMAPRWSHWLNQSDTWMWACADCEEVQDDQLIELDRLHQSYGWCGVLYWVSERRAKCRSEFADVNRFVEFARKEEEIRKAIPGDSERAYTKRQYVIGET